MPAGSTRVEWTSARFFCVFWDGGEMQFRSAILAGCIVLASCGEGGKSTQGGTPAPVPTPAPTPTPVPTPTPTPPPSSLVAKYTRLNEEAVVFRNTELAALRYPISNVARVLGYDAKGDEVVYQAGVDYRVENGTIARTVTSRIPDFGNYLYVKTTGDNYTYINDPRNPPKTVPYQVFVTYDANAFVTTIKPTGTVKKAGQLNCVGDSITSGADTPYAFYGHGPRGNFCQLLARYFPALTITNHAVPGSDVRSVWLDYDHYISPSDDIVLIAFGMNDHLFGPSYVKNFGARLSEVTKKALDSGKSVILIGFPQRNMLYDREKPDDTIAYNNAIREVAALHNVPFIDVYSAFGTLGPNRHTVETMFGDFLHHPNSYGHRVYFSMLLPYFLSSDVASESVPDYVVGAWSDCGAC